MDVSYEQYLQAWHTREPEPMPASHAAKLVKLVKQAEAEFFCITKNPPQSPTNRTGSNSIPN